MINIHPSVDCVFFKNNLVQVKLNLDHVAALKINDLAPCTKKSISETNLVPFLLKPTDQLTIEDPNGQIVMFAFEDCQITQHRSIYN